MKKTKKNLHQPGVEPGSTAWKATILAITPLMLPAISEQTLWNEQWMQICVDPEQMYGKTVHFICVFNFGFVCRMMPMFFIFYTEAEYCATGLFALLSFMLLNSVINFDFASNYGILVISWEEQAASVVYDFTTSSSKFHFCLFDKMKTNHQINCPILLLYYVLKSFKMWRKKSGVSQKSNPDHQLGRQLC